MAAGQPARSAQAPPFAPELTGLAWVNFILHFAHHVFGAVFVLYVGGRYGWDSWLIGLALALWGVLDVLVQTLLVGPLVKRWGDRRTMVFGLTVGAAGLAVLGLAPTGLLFVCGIFVSAMWGVSMPTLQALMTHRVSESEQGQLQGANMSVASLAGVVSPLFFGFVYAVSVETAPGASFLIAAIILAGAALLGRVVARRHGPV